MNLYDRRNHAIAVIEAECRLPVPSPYPAGSCIGLALRAASEGAGRPIPPEPLVVGQSVPEALKAALKGHGSVAAAWKANLARHGWREVTDGTTLPFDLRITDRQIGITSTDYLIWAWNDTGFAPVHDLENYITMRIP